MSPSPVALGLGYAGAGIAVGAPGMARDRIAVMKADGRVATSTRADVDSAIRGGAGGRRSPRSPVPYGHAPADGRNPAGHAPLDGEPATDRAGTVLYQDTTA